MTETTASLGTKRGIRELYVDGIRDMEAKIKQLKGDVADFLETVERLDEEIAQQNKIDTAEADDA